MCPYDAVTLKRNMMKKGKKILPAPFVPYTVNYLNKWGMPHIYPGDLLLSIWILYYHRNITLNNVPI